MSTFKLEYKLANETSYRTLNLKAKYFGVGWDEDQIDDGITYKNRAKVISNIHSYLND